MIGFFTFVRNLIHGVISIAVIIPVLLTAWMPGDADTPVLVNANATNPYINEYLDTDVSAHRSGAGIVPQNTLMAFEYVMKNNKKLGVDTFEFDVQITSDGELILLHNLTYDDTSNAVEAFGHKSVYASQITFDEAYNNLNLGENFTPDDGKTYPYKGLRGEDIPDNLRVVKCETVIDYIEKNSKGKEFKYIIEIKSLSFDGYKAADKLYSIITEHNLQDRVIWASSKEDVNLYMEKKYPDMPRSARLTEVVQFYIYSRMNWDLSDLGVTYVALQIPYGDNAANNFINLGTREFINYAHKYNIAVQYWTVNEYEEAELLTKNGADCIMSDYPQMVFEAVDAGKK
ncbi:MAG: hypothetical protein IKJ41_10790 [Clostridia bacterium]|nr:hypothetical protein [Clostridia bacterium]